MEIISNYDNIEFLKFDEKEKKGKYYLNFFTGPDGNKLEFRADMEIVNEYNSDDHIRLKDIFKNNIETINNLRRICQVINHICYQHYKSNFSDSEFSYQFHIISERIVNDSIQISLDNISRYLREKVFSFYFTIDSYVVTNGIYGGIIIRLTDIHYSGKSVSNLSKHFIKYN